MVKASDRPGVLAVLKQAGYKAKAEEREEDGSPGSLEIETRDGPIYVMFSDCNEAIRDLCDTLVLSTSWERTTPISDSQIAEANRTFKYVSIWRDDGGDPIMQWAILTGESGVAPPLFLGAVQRYLDIVRDFDAVAFDEVGTEVSETAPEMPKNPAPAAAPAD
ncbi:MAG: YbjN domain-containing protein [Erythrobacter sp.]